MALYALRRLVGAMSKAELLEHTLDACPAVEHDIVTFAVVASVVPEGRAPGREAAVGVRVSDLVIPCDAILGVDPDS